MPDTPSISATLHARVPPGLGDVLPPGEFLAPSYDGLGIANLPATVAALFGVELDGICPPLQRDLWASWTDGLKRIVMVVVDALGYQQLQEAMAADGDLLFHPLSEAGRLVPITSIFPSTTNAVLSTLWTGCSPATHGVLAYELYLRELGVAASTLFFWPIFHRQRDALADWGIDPETFIPVPSLAQRLIAHGITTRLFISKVYMHSLLSRIHSRGVRKTHGFVAAGDMWLGLKRTIAEHADEKLLVTAYWDTIDAITHASGPDDDAWGIELSGMSWMMRHAFLDRLSPAERDGTLLLVTADHGGLPTPPEAAIRMDQHEALRETLSLPPVGESRAVFLHTRGGAQQAAQDYMTEVLGESFTTLTREQVLSSGLLGPGPQYAETAHRLGDLVCLARGNRYLARNDAQLRILGRHGGLSAREMLVPLLGVRLDAL